MNASRRARVGRWLVRHLWYVHVPVALMLRSEPARVVAVLRTAAKPSTERLHLRNLFAEGRRYHIEPRRDGFRMMTTSKDGLRYRRRTSSTAVLRGRMEPFGDDGLTRLQIATRINTGYLLDVFLLPTFMASILIFVPWPPVIIILVLAALYLFSWFGHRYNARLEANEMIWFVQKSLEPIATAEVKHLPAQHHDVIDLQHDFESEWEKFLQQMEE
jgi:hypothetical protein